jgi:hypothetical protein
VVGVNAVEEVGDLQKEMFIGDGADELEADGKARVTETTRNGDGGDAG